MFGLSNLKRAFKKQAGLQVPRAERRSAPGLAALYGLGSATTSAGIKDISTTGIYLFTERRLSTGELITLMLQEEGKPESSSELQISVRAQVARQGEDGIGLSFVLPQGLDFDLWGVLVRNIVVLTNRDQIAEMFRTLHTILFLCRLCQSEAEEAILLVSGQRDPDRTETLVKIALAAENQLAAKPDGDRMRAHAKLLANILRGGSWTPDELNQQLWTGLLVSSCSVDAPDDSNQIFADLLVHITPIQAKIFVLACERALGSAPGAENSPSGSVVLTSMEMVELTGVHDLYRNATDLAYLFNLGLIEKVFDFSWYQDAESFDITPSRLGLELYKHCHGSREKLEQHLVDSANDHLSNFFPPPLPSIWDDESLPPQPSSSGS